MQRNAGIWIDHRKAVIVNVSDEGESTVLVKADTEDRPPHDQHFGGHVRIPADHRMQRAAESHRRAFYDSVVETIRDADRILVFGPGQAKDELVHQMEKAHLTSRVVGVEPADRMTEHEVEIKVRHRFRHTTPFSFPPVW